jgi:putative ATPase
MTSRGGAAGNPGGQSDFLRDPKPDDALRPLADRMRPRSLDEFVGQEQVLGAGKPLRQALERGQLHSLILWGPPGTGKTTLARLIARRADAEFMQLSAVMAGVKDIREAVERARAARAERGRRSVLCCKQRWSSWWSPSRWR